MDPGDVFIGNSAIVKLTSHKKIFIQPGTTIDPNIGGKFSTEILTDQPFNLASNPSLAKHYSKTNDYYPLLNNSKWFSSENMLEGNLNSYYFMSGDTVVNNNHYYKIKLKFIKLPTVLNYPFCDYSTIKTVYYLREDIENKKIYKLNNWNNSESIFYDFSLKVNDIIFNDSNCILTKIDSFKISDGIRKRFNFTCYSSNGVSWIEGIGNMSGFDPTIVSSQYSKLICVYQNNQLIYDVGEINGITCTDYNDVQSGLTDIEINSCILYPNPTTGKFRISLNNTAKIKSLKIIDIHGKLVSDVVDNLNLDQIDLNISSLLRGVYFCVICTGNEVGTFKIIKE